MFRKIILAIVLLLIVLVGVLLYNTFQFSKITPLQTSKPITNISDSAALHMSQALQIKTVSFGDTLPIDTTEFRKFKVFLETTYPTVHEKLPRLIFNEFSYVFIWKGKDTTLKPYVLMAHMDVVPVEAVAEKNWKQSPFSGLILNDTIWGRGAVDDKASVISILEATEQLLKANYQPERTIYLCFGHDEEIAGKRGAAYISKWFQQQKIEPELVLDEGGQVEKERFKKLNRSVAIIGVGEKGYVNIDLTVEIPGGHSSMPMHETAIDVLNNAIVKVRAKQMPALFPAPVQDLLQRIGPGQDFISRLAMSNRWLFNSLVVGQLEKDKGTNAMIHTTLVPTIVKAGIKDNVIPTVAKATFNSRILPGQTSDDVLNFVKKAINDDRVQVTKQTISLMEPSTLTSSDHPMFKLIENFAYQSVPNALVSPYLVLGATDSRYFRPFSNAVLNFIPLQDAKGFHGIDERIGVSDLHRMIFFYKLVMQHGNNK